MRTGITMMAILISAAMLVSAANGYASTGSRHFFIPGSACQFYDLSYVTFDAGYLATIGFTEAGVLNNDSGSYYIVCPLTTMTDSNDSGTHSVSSVYVYFSVGPSKTISCTLYEKNEGGGNFYSPITSSFTNGPTNVSYVLSFAPSGWDWAGNWSPRWSYGAGFLAMRCVMPGYSNPNTILLGIQVDLSY